MCLGLPGCTDFLTQRQRHLTDGQIKFNTGFIRGKKIVRTKPPRSKCAAVRWKRKGCRLVERFTSHSSEHPHYDCWPLQDMGFLEKASCPTSGMDPCLEVPLSRTDSPGNRRAPSLRCPTGSLRFSAMNLLSWCETHFWVPTCLQAPCWGHMLEQGLRISFSVSLPSRGRQRTWVVEPPQLAQSTGNAAAVSNSPFFCPPLHVPKYTLMPCFVAEPLLTCHP